MKCGDLDGLSSYRVLSRWSSAPDVKGLKLRPFGTPADTGLAILLINELTVILGRRAPKMGSSNSVPEPEPKAALCHRGYTERVESS